MIRSLLAAALLSLSTSALATDFSMLFDEEVLMASLDEAAPARAELLRELRETDPNAYYQQLYWTSQLMFIDREDTKIRDDSMQAWALNGLLNELAEQFMDASGADRVAVRVEMVDVASELEALERDLAASRMAALDQMVTATRSHIQRMESNSARRVEWKVRGAIKQAKSR